MTPTMMPSAIPNDALIPSAVNKRMRLAAVSVHSNMVAAALVFLEREAMDRRDQRRRRGQQLIPGILDESHVRGREVRGQEHGKGQQAQHDGPHAIGAD
jgi:hypothetical protein